MITAHSQYCEWALFVPKDYYCSFFCKLPKCNPSSDYWLILLLKWTKPLFLIPMGKNLYKFEFDFSSNIFFICFSEFFRKVTEIGESFPVYVECWKMNCKVIKTLTPLCQYSHEYILMLKTECQQRRILCCTMGTKIFWTWIWVGLFVCLF